jgi:TfoX/Sxy family transcriptional regulator of competence genes
MDDPPTDARRGQNPAQDTSGKDNAGFAPAKECAIATARQGQLSDRVMVIAIQEGFESFPICFAGTIVIQWSSLSLDRKEIMASEQEFVEFLCDQMSDAGEISSRKMFGEYAIYCGKKVVALVCGDQLFVKPTPGGKAILGHLVEAPPYPGAKPHYRIDDGLDDRERLSRLIATVERELPTPKATKVQNGKRNTRKRK